MSFIAIQRDVLTAMLPHLFAMNRQNYAHYLPVYLADMQQLELTHADVYNEFAAGNRTISHSGQPFLQVSTDIALEQSINADSKSSGGVIGISQIPSALERWFFNYPRASIYYFSSEGHLRAPRWRTCKHRKRKQLRGESNETRKM